MNREKEFVTADLYLSAFVSIYLNHFPSFKVETGQTLFIFPADATLYKALHAYNAGTPINAFEFAQQFKRLRGEMLSSRNAKYQDEMEKEKRTEGCPLLKFKLSTFQVFLTEKSQRKILESTTHTVTNFLKLHCFQFKTALLRDRSF
jgi:hypothetical protein